MGDTHDLCEKYLIYLLNTLKEAGVVGKSRTLDEFESQMTALFKCRDKSYRQHREPA